MRFILYLLGILNAFLCSMDILDILNGDTTRFHIFLTVLTGFIGIACFSSAFHSLLNDIYGGDDE